jgi:hypothetical protein
MSNPIHANTKAIHRGLAAPGASLAAWSGGFSVNAVSHKLCGEKWESWT